jgi:Leucine-rich repeat (LRR) protein
LGTLALSQRVARLESLNLSGNQLTEVLFVGDGSSEQARLRSLSLADNRLTAFALSAAVRHFPSLQRLNLSANSLTDISAAVGEKPSADDATAAGAGVAQLSQLDLSRNPQLELVCNAVLFLLPNLGRQERLID